MIINWTENRLKVIPVLSMQETKDGPVPITVAEVTLFPGYNDIPDGTYDVLRSQILEDITSKRIIEMAEVKKSSKEGQADVAIGTPFKALPPDEAIKMINNTVDVVTLKKWLKADTKRDEVRTAIQERLKEIEAKPSSIKQ